jgi:hypothetical protein
MSRGAWKFWFPAAYDFTASCTTLMSAFSGAGAAGFGLGGSLFEQPDTRITMTKLKRYPKSLKRRISVFLRYYCLLAETILPVVASRGRWFDA